MPISDATVDVTYKHAFKAFPSSVGGAVTAAAHRHGVMVSTGTDHDPDWKDSDSALVDEIVRLVENAGFDGCVERRLA